jgi:hypothetical protein
MSPDPTSLITLLPLFGQLGALVVVVWLFLRDRSEASKLFVGELADARAAFELQLKQQRDECNADRAADRADRAQERESFLNSMALMRQCVDSLAKEIRKP